MAYNNLLFDDLDKELNRLEQSETSLNISQGQIKSQDPIFDLEQEFQKLETDNEPTYPEVIGKGLLRGVEGLAGGIGSITRWAGDILGSDTISTAGKTASEYWNDAQTKGIAAPHPALYKGSFIDNPSLKRAVGIISEAVPSLAAALVTGGAATAAGLSEVAASALAATSLGLLEGAPQYEESRETGKGVAESTLYGTLSTAGTSLLEFLPISHILGRSGKTVISSLKGATEEGLQEGAQQIWQNLIAKLGYDDTRNLAEGLVESIIGGAGSGGIAGGTVAKLNSVAEKADIAGVTDDEIQAARQDLESQVENLANKVETQNLEPFQTFDPGAEERQQVIDTLGTRSGIPYEEPAPVTWQKSFNDAISRAVTAKPGPERAEAVKDIITLKQEKPVIEQTLEEINQATIDTLGTRSGIPYEEAAPQPPFIPVPPAAPRKMPGLGTLLKKDVLEPDEIAHLQSRLGKAGSWNKRIENKLIEIGELNAERPGTQTEENRQSLGEEGQTSQEEGTIPEGSEERLRIRQPGNAAISQSGEITPERRADILMRSIPVEVPGPGGKMVPNASRPASLRAMAARIKNTLGVDVNPSDYMEGVPNVSDKPYLKKVPQGKRTPAIQREEITPDNLPTNAKETGVIEEELAKFEKSPQIITPAITPAKPGMVRLDKGGVKPFTAFREITRGKNKGKIEVTLSNGKKQKVNPDQIREYPAEKTETPSLKDIKVKVKAVMEETGQEFELEQTAEESLNEIKSKRDILNELLECVS